MALTKEQKEFCTQANITEKVFFGTNAKVIDELRLDKFTSIPEGFSPYCKMLYLNGLTSIPIGFNPRGLLDYFGIALNIYLNGLTSIPEGFDPECGRLFMNGITSIPKGFNTTKCKDLYLNGLTSIPEGFNPKCSCELSLNGLTSIPEGFDPKCDVLSLNGLTSIPEGFNPKCDVLSLNGLTSIPEGFNPKVSKLYLDALTSLPKGFNPMSTVEYELSMNSLTSFPEWLNQIELKNLKLNLNSVTKVPDGWSPVLRTLYLNGLTSLPKGFNPKCEELYLKGLTSIPKDINIEADTKIYLKGEKFQKIEILIDGFKKKIEEWKTKYPKHKDDFVYNNALDRIKEDDKIRYIIIGDNPGKDEKEKGEYFVGKAGQLCRKFFKETLEINDFDKSVIALNKTPISTAKTLDLTDETKFPKEMVDETQRWMAAFSVNLYEVFGSGGMTRIFTYQIIGSSLFAPGKLFAPFAKSLEENLYRIDYHRIDFMPCVFKHFSYGHFMKDWNRYNDCLKEYGMFFNSKFEADTADSEEEDDNQVTEPAELPLLRAETGFDKYSKHIKQLGYPNYKATIGKNYPIEVPKIDEIKINENGELECYNSDGKLMIPFPIKTPYTWKKLPWKTSAKSVRKTTSGITGVEFVVQFDFKGEVRHITFSEIGWVSDATMDTVTPIRAKYD
jgi:hypothetical protein